MVRGASFSMPSSLQSANHNSKISYTVATGAAVVLLVATIVLPSAYTRTRQRRECKDEHSSDKATSSLHADSARHSHQSEPHSTAYETMIGHTPMIQLTRLSRHLQRRILVKLEHMNPGGTGKDRIALAMILEAEMSGLLPQPISTHTAHYKSTVGDVSSNDVAEDAVSTRQPTLQEVPKQPQQAQQSPSPSSTPTNTRTKHSHNASNEILDVALDALILQSQQRSQTGGLVVEGTSGSTGIALATLCQSRGHACIVVMPDDQAAEKQTCLRLMNALIHVVPNVSIAHPHHYVNLARRIAQRARDKHDMQAVFTDQFNNPANCRVHYETTGPEIKRQCRDHLGNETGRLAFCMSAGTGGTLSGVARYLKQHAQVKTVLVDPPGSVLYNKIMHGVAFTIQQAEQTLRRHRYDTLAEGIGVDRQTDNFVAGLDYIDTAVQVTDQEAVDMAHLLLEWEGLWVGSSSAMNVVGAVKTALDMPVGSTVVTLICDGGQRHVTRFWNRDFVVNERGLEWPGDARRLPECMRNVGVVADEEDRNG
jgi:cysteine synthase